MKTIFKIVLFPLVLISLPFFAFGIFYYSLIDDEEPEEPETKGEALAKLRRLKGQI